MSNTVTLPNDPIEIVNRLSDVSDETNLVNKMYAEIARNAGREFLPEGIVMMFTLAAWDFEKQYPPPLGSFLMLLMPRWIDALIDDKEAAEAAKSILKDAEDAVEEEIKSQTPPRVEPKGPLENDRVYFAIRKVADIFFEEIRKAQDAGADLDVAFGDDG